MSNLITARNHTDAVAGIILAGGSFETALRDQLYALHGDKAMWRLLDELGDQVARVEVDRDLPDDIDTTACCDLCHLPGIVKGAVT